MIYTIDAGIALTVIGMGIGLNPGVMKRWNMQFGITFGLCMEMINPLTPLGQDGLLSCFVPGDPLTPMGGPIGTGPSLCLQWDLGDWFCAVWHKYSYFFLLYCSWIILSMNSWGDLRYLFATSFSIRASTGESLIFMISSKQVEHQLLPLLIHVLDGSSMKFTSGGYTQVFHQWLLHLKESICFLLPITHLESILFWSCYLHWCEYKVCSGETRFSGGDSWVLINRSQRPQEIHRSIWYLFEWLNVLLTPFGRQKSLRDYFYLLLIWLEVIICLIHNEVIYAFSKFDLHFFWNLT